MEKNRSSHSESTTASQSVSNALEQRLKEPKLLLFFFCGAIYEFTYNDDDVFSQSQMALLFEIPSQEDINQLQKMKVLAAPPGLKVIEYDPTYNKESYLEKGFKEVKVGISPERIQSIGFIHAQHTQYVLRHHVTETIHSGMGDTLVKMATEISTSNPYFKLWDKGQLVVIISQTMFAKDTICVGQKNETLNVLRQLLMQNTQWTDFMEAVLDIITINNDSSTEYNKSNQQQSRTMTLQTFPYRICDVNLPQCQTGFVYFPILCLESNIFLYW